MSQYNKTVLTNAGLELAKRANSGQAKFKITRAVTSADDWSDKTIQDLEAVTTIPNIMQQGTIMDTEEVESNNSVIGVSLCFANKDLNTSYQIRIIGLYAKEERQENDFLYAVTTAVTPEYMPDFSDGILYRFNMQMYLVIGKAQAVNVVINDGSSVTHGQLDKYKSEVTANLKKIENTHKEDMSHVVKSANINGGDDILPDEAGKLNLVVPDPDLSSYVSLEQLTETLKTKADITAIPDKTATEEGIKQAKELAQEADTKAQNALPKSGGNMDLRSNINWSGVGINDRTGNLGGLYWSGGSDTASIYGDQNANDNLDLVFDLGDDGSNHFSFRNKGGEVAAIRSNGHYTGTVDWGNVWGRPDVTPIVNGAAGDDLFAFKSNQIRLYPGNGKNCKNLPPASNTQWFTVQYVFEAPNSDGVAIFRSPANEVWMVGNNGASYNTGWTRLANSGDISNLQNIINQQNQTIQSLTTRLNNAENEIRYIKANYVEGRRFPASQEAQAEAWENEKPQRIAFIER